MKRDLIKEIEELDLSDINKVIDILTYDFKNEFDINYDNVFVKKANISNIEKFLKYRTISLIKPNTFLDCDISELAKNVLQNIYCKEKYNLKSVVKNNRIYNVEIDGRNIMFESDTLNSFQTIFGAYIRCFLCRKYDNLSWGELYKKDYNLESDAFRNIWTLQNINEIKQKVETNLEKEIFNELEILAGLTHTIGNFALVPYKFNTYRGTKFSDYWDLSYNKITNCDNIDKISKDMVENYVEYLKSINFKWKIDENKIQEEIKNSIQEYQNIKKSYDKFDKICDNRPTSLIYEKFLNEKNLDKEAEGEIYLKILKEMNNFIIQRGIMVILELCGKNTEEIQIDKEELVEKIKDKILKK